ncbi:MAG: HDOD domain-containing protein [Proteobacteria bacterium]|nr:HDOD domain-containing protein [Pseudomonadota bacterium]
MTTVLDSRTAPLGSSPAPLAAIAWGRDLPALPAAVLELLALLASENVDIDELAAKVSVDVALTAKTLRMANSSFYSLRREVTSVPDAIAMLGLRMVKGIVTAASVGGSFKPPACPGFDFKAFWRHGVATAVAAQMLALDAEVDPGVAFTTGLLYNIGELVFASSFPDHYAAVLVCRLKTGAEAREAERSLLGVDRATVGARVAEVWRLPEAIVRAMRREPGTDSDLGRVVDAADRLMQAVALGDDALAAAAAVLAVDASAFGLDEERWADVATSAGEQTEAICASLN